MRLNSSAVIALAVACQASWFAASSRAVIVAGNNGTGTTNTAAPYPVAGLNNVGTVNFGPAGSGVYLGSGWVLTAAHLGNYSQNPSFSILSGPGAGTYSNDGTFVRLKNADTTATDLVMFHLATSPTLPTLTLSPSTPALNTSIYSMGYGQTRSANVQYYSVSGTTFTPLPSSTGANASGYTESGPQVIRWGTNLTASPPGASATAASETIDSGGFGNVTIFGSNFDSTGTASESQTSSGDSGGGVFDTNNVLIGINEFEFTATGQPASTAIFGDASGYTDIATYRSQIQAVLPEPSTFGIAAFTTAGLLARRRRVMR